MTIHEIIIYHDAIKAHQLKDRFSKHGDIQSLLEKLPPTFERTILGKSVEGKEVTLVKWGKGSVKVLLWSQMHGDEATGTMALFDLLNFLQSEIPLAYLLAECCQLYILPMVNPDGAARFTRRNAQQIDVNRDFLVAVSPEAQMLKKVQATVRPDFGFNLHDQSTLWSVTDSLKPATLSFLAPAFDRELNINQNRKNAMLVIAQMYADLSTVLPGQIGLFDDEFEPRAFGDNFQKAGTATILIEAGGYGQDFEKQEIRKHYFAAIISGLQSIAAKSYELQDLSTYLSIPKNNKQIFHILIHALKINDIKVSIGINYDEYPNPDGNSTMRNYVVQDLGDLSLCEGYETFDGGNLTLNGEIEVFKNANFELFAGNKEILCFKDGKLL